MKDQIEMILADEFPILSQMVFMNHAGVAPISGRAAAALRRYTEQAESQAYYHSGWYERVVQVKELASRTIGAAGPHEIAFVASTSMGLSLVAGGIDFQPGDDVIITNVEFPANRYPWEDLQRRGVELIEVRQQDDGRIDVEDVVEAVTNRTRIVSISHVQYASGHRIDLRPISDMVHRAGGFLCVDAIQSVGAMPVDVSAAGIDFLTADGHKWLLGPEGCGIFYCRAELTDALHPSVIGWLNMVNPDDYGDYQFQFQPDARRFEAGSYNIAGITALGASMQLLLEVGLDQVWSRIDELTSRLCDGLRDKDYRVFSPRDPDERSGIVTFNAPYPDTRLTPPVSQLVSDLEDKGIVLVAREGRLRASPHFYNTPEQIDELIKVLP